MLLAVLLGLLAGFVRARVNHRRLHLPELRDIWAVYLAVIPQLAILYPPPLASRIPTPVAVGILVVSQGLLLWFGWRNRHQPGLSILTLGALANGLVMVLNGGLMPIRPDAVRAIYPAAPPGSWQVGQRLGYGKDIVLNVDQTRLWWLSDYFVVSEWSPVLFAFSLGDVLIAIGAFLFLYSLGRFDTTSN